LQVDLCDLLLHPGVRLRRSADLAADIAALAADAQEAGLNAACGQAFHHLARVYYWALQDFPRARAALLHAGELLASVPPAAPNLEPLVEGARCLAQLEIGIPRARELFANLARIHGANATLGYQWGLGLLRRWDGAAAEARAALTAALALARQAKKHWAEFDIAATLVMTEIESGDPARALELAHQLRPLAERLGEGGSEGPVVDALEALARYRSRDPAASAALEASARALERIDSQYHLGYLLNTAASIDLEAQDTRAAGPHAEAGLRASLAAERDVEIRRAHLLVAAIARRDGRIDDARTAARALGPIDPDALPARARRLLTEITPLLP
jgi:hypothetical protein